jgi:hypothetical protein
MAAISFRSIFAMLSSLAASVNIKAHSDKYFIVSKSSSDAERRIDGIRLCYMYGNRVDTISF